MFQCFVVVVDLCCNIGKVCKNLSLNLWRSAGGGKEKGDIGLYISLIAGIVGKFKMYQKINTFMK